MGNLGTLEVMFIAFIIPIIPAWKILKKAGFNPRLSFICLIPVLNIIALWIFAFIEWPSNKSNA